jgi:lipopolysaccharide export system protein LptA
MPLCGIALAALIARFPSSMLRSFAFVFAGLAVAASSVQAEKADRFKPLNVEADLPGKIDLLNQYVVFNGNVVVTKGTMTIRASRIEVRESPDGYHNAVAFGSPSQHATFRQKRDAPDEYIAGEAERLEYDGKSDVIRFVNNASVRRLRGSETSDEISGNLVTYDSGTEVFNVTGGAPATASNPGGRVRAVLTPKEGSAAAAEAARAASAAASAPPQLRTAPSLGGDKR